MARRRRALILALALGACDRSTVDTGDERVTVELSAVVPTVALLSWDSDQRGTALVEYGLDDALDTRTPVTTEVGREHTVALLGLKAGRSYAWRAIFVDRSGEEHEVESGTVDVGHPPERLHSLDITVRDDSRMMPGGYLLTSQIGPGTSWVVIFDRDGDVVWYYDDPDGLNAFTAKPGPDHTLSFVLSDPQQDRDIGGVDRMTLDGRARIRTRTEVGHHDFVDLPDGRVAYLSVDFREVDGHLLAVDRIVEAPFGSDDPADHQEVFGFFDDYPGDVWTYCDPSGERLWFTDAVDCTHGNSLLYDGDDDAYLLMARNLDAILKIDRASGAVVWQMGGARSDFALAEDDAWSHGHFSQIWDGGLMVFDNGYAYQPQRSRAVEYAFDEQARTVTQVWEYRDPAGRFVQMLGDARKLPNGNQLVCWTTAGLVTEHGADGELAWQGQTRLGSALTRVRWIEDLYGPW